MQAKSLAVALYEKNNGIISASEYTIQVTATNSAFDSIKEIVTSYKNNFNTFFNSAPRENWRKLFKSYVLIGYSTKADDFKLDSINVPLRSVAPNTLASVVTAVTSPDFRIVQCLNSDIVLVDGCYQNKYPYRIPMPSFRGINSFYNNGVLENNF
jgi:hypothetical protein